MATAPATSNVIHIEPIQTETVMLAVLGGAPLIINRLAEKARQELLLPKGRKTTAEKASSLKHNPQEEFRASPYIVEDDDAETYLAITSASFKKAMMGAALRIPGAKKTEIAQLVRVDGLLTGVFGVPEIFSAITRSADINRTPDVRTRAIIPEWAAVVSITYTVPILNKTSVVNLLAAAGQVNGVGDWRIEKGGWCGAFRITDPSDPDFRRIVAAGGRAEQIEAMAAPKPYNGETGELLAWFESELETRGKKAA